MVGQSFESYMSRILKLIGFEFSTMVGENFEYYFSQIAKIAFKLSRRSALGPLLPTLVVSDHSCTQSTGKISAPGIGNSTPAPVNLGFHSQDLVEKGHTLQTGHRV